jgi:hypothetical protein
MIQKLKALEKSVLIDILNATPEWQKNNLRSLLIDYYPPVVERVWYQVDNLRLYLHVIHQSKEKDCLFHKHKWPSAIHVVYGNYEMALAYSEETVNSEQAYALPVVSKIELAEGSYYEMTAPHGMHYVNPLTEITMSTMVTDLPYPENIREAEHPKLKPLTEERFFEVLAMFKLVMTDDY